MAKTLLSRPIYLASKPQETAWCCFLRIRVPYMTLHLEFLRGFWILNSAPHTWKTSTLLNKSSPHEWCFPIINTLTEPTFNMCVYLCSNILSIFLRALYWEKLQGMFGERDWYKQVLGGGYGEHWALSWEPRFEPCLASCAQGAGPLLATAPLSVTPCKPEKLQF